MSARLDRLIRAAGAGPGPDGRTYESVLVGCTWTIQAVTDRGPEPLTRQDAELIDYILTKILDGELP
jgi:hypothetical protein